MAFQTTQFDTIRAVVEMQLFPQIVKDVPGTQRFMQWRTSLNLIPTSTLIELMVTAVTQAAYVACQKHRFYMETSQSAESIIFMLDVMLLKMVQDIVKIPDPHVPGQLCENVACAECYS